MLDGHEFKLVRWYKDDGDVVRPGEAICELETDRANMDLESWTTGILRRRARPGDVIRSADDIGRIEPVSN